MTKAGHGLAWKICLFLAFCHWVDANRPDDSTENQPAATVEKAGE